MPNRVEYDTGRFLNSVTNSHFDHLPWDVSAAEVIAKRPKAQRLGSWQETWKHVAHGVGGSTQRGDGTHAVMTFRRVPPRPFSSPRATRRSCS